MSQGPVGGKGVTQRRMRRSQRAHFTVHRQRLRSGNSRIAKGLTTRTIVWRFAAGAGTGDGIRQLSSCGL